MGLPRVFLCGTDNVGWALDDDLSLTRAALTGLVEFDDITECDVVHSVWWEALLRLPREQLAGKRIICHASGEPNRLMTLPGFLEARRLVSLWIAQSAQAQTQFDAFNIRASLVPYAVDEQVFHPIDRSDPRLTALRDQWGIPSDRYLIGNFHRDTEGGDLVSPKLVKGPDLFAEIVGELRRRGMPVHVLLAGPRRFWLRDRLAAYGVPFTYIGQSVEDDDMAINRQPKDVLNLLYNLLDLYLITSRSEGGPRAVLEGVAAGCKVLSSPVGLALDVLSAPCIYADVPQAVEIIQSDCNDGRLTGELLAQRLRVLQEHLPSTNSSRFAEIYRGAESIAPFTPQVFASSPQAQPRVLGSLRRFFSKKRDDRQLVVCLWHKFFEPPYGGGNQFMLCLRKALLAKGVKVVENTLDSSIDAYVLNSVQFDVERFLDFKRVQDIKVIHRIDGPIQLIRGCDREKDDLVFRLNREFAAVSVIQSCWTLRQSIALGYAPVNPLVVRNGVDKEIFHDKGRVDFDRSRKLRLVASSWSDNPRKGGEFYRWLEERLDWDRYEFTFVGRASVAFAKARHIPPVNSDTLAEILRQHDIYVTASCNDPCSNAVLEALACGLPVMYLNDGGHPELVGSGGLSFEGRTDFFGQLERLVDNYQLFQNLIVVEGADTVAGTYLDIIRNCVRED